MLFQSRIYSGGPARRFAAAAALCLLTAAGSARAEDGPIALAPNNPDVVAVVQVADILASPAFQKITADFPEIGKKLDEPLGEKTKLTPRDIESIVVTADTAQRDFVVVINLTGEVGVEDIVEEKDRDNTETIGDYTLYIAEDKALCLVDESTLAIAPPATLRAVLQRDDDAELSAEFAAGWKNVDDDQQVYVFATLGALIPLAADAIPPGMGLTADTLAKLTTATFSANAGENQITISTDLNCTDKETATQFKTLLDTVLQGLQQPNAQIPAEAKQALTSVQSSVSEEFLTIGFDLGLDLILGQIKSQLATGASATPTP
ncbi:MAG TPA: hypothetical protein VHC22_06610 [Pirellulales bacterium]|nr:hypothetical protein [Pirellulales bacterium]